MPLSQKNISNIHVLENLPVLLRELDPSSILVVTDAHVEKLHLTSLKLKNTPTFLLKRGEKGKDINEIKRLWKYMLEIGFDRNGLVLSFGGGSISDSAGFAASTYKRGVRVINIPTTLLAMVDAAHGGKTGINLSGLKNQIGTFAHAQAVIIHTPFLASLKEVEIKNGLAEMLKHGLILSPNHWNSLQEYPDIDWEKAIIDSIKLKTEVVEKDPEETGYRQILNFGHTFGHAIESHWNATRKTSLMHGYAVAAGIIMETHASLNYGLTTNAHDEIVHTLLAIYGKLKVEKKDINGIMEMMKADKKNRLNKIRFISLSAIGKTSGPAELNQKSIKDAWEFYCSL